MPIKLFYSLVLLFFLFSCSANKVKESEDKKKEMEQEDIVEPVTTEYPFKLVDLPSEFFKDTVLWKDSITCTSFQFEILASKSKAETKFETYQWAQFQKKYQYELSYVDSCDLEFNYPAYDVIIGLKSIFKSNRILSVQYVEDSYGEGGNHHNYSLYSLNFDLIKEKGIEMQDFLKLKTDKDTNEFLALLGANQEVKDCMEIHFFEGRMDFTIKENGIQFNPYSPWSCGLNSCFLTWEQMKNAPMFKIFWLN